RNMPTTTSATTRALSALAWGPSWTATSTRTPPTAATSSWLARSPSRTEHRRADWRIFARRRAACPPPHCFQSALLGRLLQPLRQFQRLPLEQPPVDPAFAADQHVVRALLDDSPGIEDEQAVELAHGGEP